MLSISLPMKGAGAGNYYLKLAKEDYYANSVEEPGHWSGGGAERLGLAGEVDAPTFRNLLNGFSPDGRTPLVQNAGEPERQSGWDLTFSAFKAMSVLWSQAPESVRRHLESIQVRSAAKALRYVEEVAGVTRRGKGGATKEEARLVFALFPHRTSRALDPQLHIHALLINLGCRADGTTGTLDTRSVFRLKMAAGAVYRNELARLLREELHLTVEPRKVGFRIVGVPESMCRLFSKPRQSIERLMNEKGRSDAVAAKIATLETRPRKGEVSADHLFAQWQRVGKHFGWGQAEAVKLLRDCARGHQPSPASPRQFKGEDADGERFQEAGPDRSTGGHKRDSRQDRFGGREHTHGCADSAQREQSREDREEAQRTRQSAQQGKAGKRARYADQIFEEEFWRQAEFIPNWRRNRRTAFGLAMRLARQYGASKETMRRVMDEFQTRPTLDQRYKFQFGWRRGVSQGAHLEFGPFREGSLGDLSEASIAVGQDSLEPGVLPGRIAHPAAEVLSRCAPVEFRARQGSAGLAHRLPAQPSGAGGQASVGQDSLGADDREDPGAAAKEAALPARPQVESGPCR